MYKVGANKFMISMDIEGVTTLCPLQEGYKDLPRNTGHRSCDSWDMWQHVVTVDVRSTLPNADWLTSSIHTVYKT
jgi:hypothetical protein